jgi:integrase
MATVKLTDKIARDEPVPAKGYVIVNDDTVAGFGLLVTAAGARSFVFRYRHARRSRRYTIGSFPSWTAARARQRAKELDRLVDQGLDPQGDKDQARKAPNVNELCDRYLAEHAPKKRSGAEDQKMIDAYVRPTLGTKRVVDVTYDDCYQLHQRITKWGKRERPAPYRANRVATLLRKMLSLAIRWKMRSDNPCVGIERNAEQPAERYLKADELNRLLDVLAGLEDRQVANIIRLLMETGCRPGELFKSTWAQFEKEPGIWVKPAGNTKDNRAHRIPMSGPARLLLSKMKQEAKSEFLFPGKGTDHITTIKESWGKICKAAQIEGRFRVYDLRHSNASFLADDGKDLLTIGAMLGHSQIATTRRYIHLFDSKLKAAAEGIGARLERKPKAEVLPIRRRKA